MSNIDKLKEALADSVRAKESEKAETLRGLLANIHNEEIAKRSKGSDEALSEDEINSVLRRESKKRKESAEIYGEAGRDDLESKELNELTIIEEYLPAGLGRDEVVKIVKDVAPAGEENFGKVMGVVMKEVAGRADARIVSEVVREFIGGAE